MPELPEVEVVRRGLAAWAVGRVVASVEVEHPRAVRRHLPGADDFGSRLRGRTLAAACRRGKYLWLPLTGPAPPADPADPAGAGAAAGPAGPGADPGAVGDPPDEALLGHLGMSGQLLLAPPRQPAQTHLRVRIGFADGGPDLRFVDQRTFGGLSVEPLVDADGARLPRSIRHIARDPLDPAFDAAAFALALRRRRTGIKRALLDQSLVSGIGNIYADEALWGARLHWARPTETLTRPVVARLLAAARAVMAAALAAGGTSFDSLYVNVNGESGYFDRALAVYGRQHQPCRRCGTPIRRDSFMNRSSYTCPRCQPRPRRGRW
jgi:formamidopyrimidine-DNA glycosylase